MQPTCILLACASTNTLFFIYLYMYIYTHNCMDKTRCFTYISFITYANMRHKSLPAVHVLTNLDGNQSLSGFGYVSRHIDVCTRGILEIEK